MSTSSIVPHSPVKLPVHRLGSAHQRATFLHGRGCDYIVQGSTSHMSDWSCTCDEQSVSVRSVRSVTSRLYVCYIRSANSENISLLCQILVFLPNISPFAQYLSLHRTLAFAIPNISLFRPILAFSVQDGNRTQVLLGTARCSTWPCLVLCAAAPSHGWVLLGTVCCSTQPWLGAVQYCALQYPALAGYCALQYLA